jgi:calcium-dependent protein kinase
LEKVGGVKSPLFLQEDVKDVQREVQVLRLIGKHENVAELINVFEDSTYVHLVLELCKGGELFDRVVAKGTFTEKMAAGGLFNHRTPSPNTSRFA